MGVSWPVGARARQLSRTTNCSRSSFTRSVCRLGGKPVIRPHVLVKSTGTERARGRPGTNARFTVAKGGVDRRLRLQRRAGRYDRGARLALSAALYNSVAQGHYRTAGNGSTLFRCTFSATGARSHRVNRYAGLTYSLVWQTIREYEPERSG